MIHQDGKYCYEVERKNPDANPYLYGTCEYMEWYRGYAEANNSDADSPFGEMDLDNPAEELIS